jgi:hypothetical protein
MPALRGSGFSPAQNVGKTPVFAFSAWCGVQEKSNA